MDANFWHQRWETNRIGFHESNVNPLLVRYFEALAIAKGGRIFVPLCGKTRDIAWFMSNGYRVAGAELSELAIRQLFAELEMTPQITDAGAMKHYSAAGIDIFVGDIFDLTRSTLGAVDAVFDRAALVALPENMRTGYAGHITEITAGASQLLITYAYDQKLMDGPPFSISHDEINRHYEDVYDVSQLASVDLTDGLKGTLMVKENVWLLKPLDNVS